MELEVGDFTYEPDECVPAVDPACNTAADLADSIGLLTIKRGTQI